MEESKEKLLKAVRHYQDSLDRHTKTGNTEKLLHAIEKLSRLPIKVCHLEETGIGRTVNGLKKIDGQVGENARNLVDKWKSMVKGEDQAEQERTERKSAATIREEKEENVENEPMDEDPDPESLQICDEDEHSDSEKPSYVETNTSSHRKSSSSNKDDRNSNNRHNNHNKRSRSSERHDKKSKRDRSSEKSDNNSSGCESDTNHKSKKPKYDRDHHKNSKKSSHKSRRNSSDSESNSETNSSDSGSEAESTASRKTGRKTSRRNSSASSDNSSSGSSYQSSENDSSSDRSSKKNRTSKHHSDKKDKKSYSKDSSESNSDRESKDRHRTSKEKNNKNKEKELYKKHSKSNSESDRDVRDKYSKSRDSKHESKNKHKSTEKTDSSKDKQSKSHESKHEKSNKERESSSKKDSSSSKSKTKHEDSDSKHKRESKEIERSKHKSDSDRDSKKLSKTDKYKESNGHTDSKSSKFHKEKESSSKSPSNKNREPDHSTDRDSKKHKGSSDSKESKNDSHRSSGSSKSATKETSESKKESDNKKDKEKDKKERSESEKKKKESSSSSSSSKSTKEKDKEKPKAQSSSSSSSSKPKSLPKTVPIIIDSESGTSFADALGMLEAPVFSKSKKKNSTIGSHEKYTPEKSFSNDKAEKVPKSTANASAGRSSSSREMSEVPKLLKDPGELEPLDINISGLLPSITPNYRPLGLPLDNQNKKMWMDDEALSRVITAKHQRTKVYSGNKSTYTKVPTLFDLCSRVLQDNIDALEYTGGVPYSILKPIIEKANPDQLFQLEFHNPYLIDDTDELWLLHCQKEFRTKKREEMESWREMYLRCLDEREAKLKALTANIKQSQDVKVPVRTTKLAYLDTVVKPPRNIARKQAKNGTAVDIKRPSQTPTERLNQLAKSGEASKVAVPNPGKVAVERSSTSHSHSSHLKPKKAPLMAKTLSLLKNRFGRR